ncbi:hypothetical protein BIY23_04045 [Wolbachia pipientis]|uniref:Uncharacterized protein n=1 Tax=Wolbachia pipientis TaxID=955 RepID=A0A1E7QJA4_WOLPI|nr:ankyrin repeat domain-containing protein [Wolbachia pipientis]OEY86457.1 hypothetical protein BIY23_04045 [Wolbachia pipientis]
MPEVISNGESKSISNILNTSRDRFKTILSKLDNDPKVDKDNFLVKLQDQLSAAYHVGIHVRIEDLIIEEYDSIIEECKDKYGLLHLVAQNSYINIADILLALRVHVDVPSQFDHTPLHYAIRFEQKEMIKFLLKNGAQIDKQNANGQTPLHLAVGKEYKIVKPVFKKAAKQNTLDIQDKNGMTLLHYAARNSNYQAVEFLLKHKAKDNIIDVDGKIPLDYASDKQIKKLLERYIPKKKSETQLPHNKIKNAVHYVMSHVSSGSILSVPQNINQSNNQQYTQEKSTGKKWASETLQQDSNQIVKATDTEKKPIMRTNHGGASSTTLKYMSQTKQHEEHTQQSNDQEEYIPSTKLRYKKNNTDLSQDRNTKTTRNKKLSEVFHRDKSKSITDLSDPMLQNDNHKDSTEHKQEKHKSSMNIKRQSLNPLSNEGQNSLLSNTCNSKSQISLNDQSLYSSVNATPNEQLPHEHHNNPSNTGERKLINDHQQSKKDDHITGHHNKHVSINNEHSNQPLSKNHNNTKRTNSPQQHTNQCTVKKPSISTQGRATKNTQQTPTISSNNGIHQIQDLKPKKSTGITKLCTIFTIIASIVTLLLLMHFTALSVLTIIGLTIASALATNLVTNKISTTLSEPNCNNTLHTEATKQL